jgi:hypothetical protein
VGRRGAVHHRVPARTHRRVVGEKEITQKTNDYVFAPDLVAAAREFIRSEGDSCIVSIGQLLDELSGEFGDRLPVSLDTYKVLDLIETL